MNLENPQNFDKEDSDTNHICTSTIIDEMEMDQYNQNPQSLYMENQTLKKQLERALRMASEIDQINNKNTNLLGKLQESNLKVEGLQQKLKITQQKNQDLENKNIELYNLYQNLNKKANDNEKFLQETKLNLTESENNAKQMKDHVETLLNDNSVFLNSINQLFNTNLSTLSQLYSFIQDFKLTSEKKQQSISNNKEQIIQDLSEKNENYQTQIDKLKKSNSALKKANSSLTNQLNQKTEECSQAHNEIEILKRNIEENSQKLQTLVSSNESQKEHEQNLHNMINQLQTDRKEEINKFQQMMALKDTRIRELQEKLTSPSHEEDKDYIRTIQELSIAKSENNEIKQKLAEQTELTKSYRNKLGNCVKKLQQYQKNCDELKRKLGEISQKKIQSEQMQSKLNDQISEEIQQHKLLEKENLELQAQLQDLLLHKNENDSSLKQQSIERIQHALAKIDPIIHQQESEISTLAMERKKFVNIIQTQTQMLALYDLHLKNNEQKISQMSNKLKNNNSESVFCGLFESLIIPELDSESRLKFLNILSNQSQSLKSKIEALFSNLVQIVKKSNEKVAFKISMISDVTGRKFTRDSFMDYIYSQMNSHLNSVSSISPFKGSFETRTTALKQIIEGKINLQQLIDLFSAQIIINIILEDENSKIKEELASSNTFRHQFQEYFGEHTIEDIWHKLQSLSFKAKKLKKLKSQSNEEYYQELEEQILKQKEKIKTLENGMRTLVNDAGVMQTQLEIQTEQFKTLQENYQKVQIESSQIQSKHMEELNKYEKIIEERNNDIKILNTKITTLSIESGQKIKSLEKINEDMAKTNSLKEEKYQKYISSLKGHLSKMNSKLHSSEEYKKTKILQLAKIQSELRDKLNESLTVMKKQFNENQALSNQLNESIMAKENISKAFNEEINKLSIAKKAVEMQCQSLKEQSKREIDILNSQYNFKALAERTKHQEEINSIKTELVTQKNNIVLSILEEFDELNSMNIDDFDNINFQIKIKEIAQKYRAFKLGSICK